MSEKPNYFVRILIVGFVVALVSMVFVSFSFADTKYQITAGIITVVGFIVILILSESFNNLSLGKILSLSREVQKKEDEKVQVKTENKELRQELFKIVSNIQQSQVNNTYNAPSDEWLKLLGVVKAQEPEKEEDQEEQKEVQRAMSYMAEREKSREESRQRMKQRRTAEYVGISKYAANLSIPDTEIITGAEFSQAFDEIDPIMNRRIVFDGYIKGEHQERFIDVRPKNLVSPMYYDRLYVMLNKIHLYRKAKGISAELVLIILDIEGESEDRPWRSERFYEYFQSAISNKLLKIESIKISAKDIESFDSNDQQSLL
ncbi:hypothetical protein PspMM1_15580 [Pseudoalteromonas sp. MM1]|uniref:hypothetical protein n=1 Tax=Pseudoalteromonas sp. MM1 TaxID=3036714 RepID=UPI002573C512|nr:hypothetical protein [Pseudoalteromonas sp. MM1]BED89090.1 hypothetical protein PspMM1_15580 [Pseudoalteromonas sp. MM1]